MTTLPDEPIATYGQWTVYEDYIDCARVGYCLTRQELAARGADWWDAHMAPKRWCWLADFVAAREALVALAEVAA